MAASGLHLDHGTQLYHASVQCQDLLRKCEANAILGSLGWLQKAQGDFNIWCFGLGATKKGKASLDSAVKHRSDIRDIISGLLEGLQESLEISLEIASQSIEDEAAQSDGDTGNFRDGEDDSLSEEHFNVKTTLKQLNRIHLAIRRYGASFRHQKADAYFSHKAKHPELEDFKNEMMNVIRLGLRHSNTKYIPYDELLNTPLNVVQLRLVTANLMRRNRIYHETKQLRKESEKYKKIKDDAERVKRYTFLDEFGIGTVSIETVPDVFPEPKPAQSIRKSDWSTSHRPSSRSDSQQLPATDKSFSLDRTAVDLRSNFKLRIKETEKPATIITSITKIGSKQDYPPCPKPSGLGTLTSCPYCAEPLDIDYTKNNSRWRGHLAADLIPYTCMFEQCDRATEMFATADDLARHVKSEHGIVRWVCDYCTANLDPGQMVIFESAEEWCDHVAETHAPSTTLEHLKTLAQTSSRMMIGVLNCPLCSFSTETVQAELPDHIAEHLHAFSLRALPWDAGNNEVASLNNDRMSNGSQQDSADGPFDCEAEDTIDNYVASDSDPITDTKGLQERLVRLLKEVSGTVGLANSVSFASISVAPLILGRLTDPQCSADLIDVCARHIFRAEMILSQIVQSRAVEENWSIDLCNELLAALQNEGEDIHSLLVHPAQHEPLDKQPYDALTAQSDALALLRNGLGESLFEEKYATQLVLELNFDPVAIRFATAFIRTASPRVRFDDYIRRLKGLKNMKNSVYNLSTGETIDVRDASIVLEITHRHWFRAHKEALRFLEALSIFAHKIISKTMLESLYPECHRHFDVLQSYGLIVVNNDQQSITVEPDVQAYVVGYLIRDDKYENGRNDLVKELSGTFPPVTFEHWPQCQLWFEQTRALFAENSHYSSDPGYIRWASLLCKAAIYARAKGHSQIAKELLEHAVDFWKTTGSPPILAWQTAYIELAAALTDLGHYTAAEEAFKQADSFEVSAASAQAWSGNEYFEKNVFLHMHRYGTVDEQIQNSIVKNFELRRQNLADDDPVTLRCRDLVATGYFMQGEYAKAAEIDSNLVTLRETICGSHHPDTLTSLSHLAATFCAQGRYEMAKLLETQALERSREVLGELHPDTLTSFANLMAIRWYKGETDDVVSHEKAYSDRAKVLGDNHPSTLTSLHNLAFIEMCNGNCEDAEPMMIEVLAARKRIFRPGHPDVILAERNLADLETRLGRYTEASDRLDRLHRQCLLEKNNLPPPICAEIAHNYATLLIITGRPFEAQAALTRSYHLIQISNRKLLGPLERSLNHPSSFQLLDEDISGDDGETNNQAYDKEDPYQELISRMRARLRELGA